MLEWLQLAGWLACIVYATIPAFWLMIHPFAERWRARRRSPYFLLLPAWIALWIAVALVTSPWRNVVLYRVYWPWAGAALLFALGFYIYSQAGKNFSAKQLGGVPELHGGSHDSRPDQRLVTDGIRARVRHPIYLAHLCEMLAWSVGTGLAVCWGLTAFAMVLGALMIWMEDAELEKRFGQQYRIYRQTTPALLPIFRSPKQLPRLQMSEDRAIIYYEVGGRVVWQIAISNLVCIAEYTTRAGPWLDDYFLVFVDAGGECYQASFYSDGRDAALEVLSATLKCTLCLGLTSSTDSASRILWPPSLEGQSTFINVSGTAVLNPNIEALVNKDSYNPQ